MSKSIYKLDDRDKFTEENEAEALRIFVKIVLVLIIIAALLTIYFKFLK